MEIQGPCKAVMPFALDFDQLEGATTGVLETVSSESVECEYCLVRYRNEDCLLPWFIGDLVRVNLENV